ncbi:hypothetical protein DSO57_1005844 [Entomophthora muscae]|uniref:Uncharacterized protein n=1 Tax=Entomophthora muscae TaxID=34485 RepID=A0ACC2UUS0_9FUNG|nr:hypothetical protein DSO57_1005844 [Entomophthora muscae]
MKIFITFAVAVFGVQHVKSPTCPGAACVFPVDGAEFLTGARFDIRIEMHGEQTVPDDSFSVTIAKAGAPETELGTFFNLERPKLETWDFSYAKDGADYYRALEGERSVLIPVKVASRIWRRAAFKEPGNYIVTTTYSGGKRHQVEWIVRGASCQRLARNAILFIADGTTINMITAARVMAKQQRNGKFFDKFELDKMEHIGHILTHSLGSMMTDSACSASAYHTGHKTAVNALGVYPDSSPDHFDDPKQELLAELARRRSPSKGGKMAVGIVTTAEVQDATPAAVFAHTRRRKNKADILHQLLYSINNDTAPIAADVLLGGGGKYFQGSLSRNKENYYKKFSGEFGYDVIHNGTQLRKYSGKGPLLGIFHKSDMDVYVDRQMMPNNLKNNQASPLGDKADALDQPTLVDMTKAALDVLKKRGGDGGFFAMIEAASPDKQMHTMDFHRALVEIIEFDQAIKAAVEWARQHDPETLIVVTADHGHGFDVFGSVDTYAFNRAAKDKHNLSKRQAIGVYGEAGWPDYEDKDGDGFPDSLAVRTVFAGATVNHPDILENFQMNLTHPRNLAIRSYETPHKLSISIPDPNFNQNGMEITGNTPAENTEAVHSMTDVGVFASGPGSHLFGRVMDSTEVFFNFAFILGLGDAAPHHCRNCHQRSKHY